jgi:hypothetical protein
MMNYKEFERKLSLLTSPLQPVIKEKMEPEHS